MNLKLYSCKLPESSLYESEDSLAIECFALQLDAWHPSWKARTEDSSPLYIAVDEDFKRSSFHVQLIGRTSRGTNFALPFAYKFRRLSSVLASGLLRPARQAASAELCLSARYRSQWRV